MKEIGDYLHQVREEKKISLKEIQEATKISMRYLEAIDIGNFEAIPGEVYRKGFMVNFANAIGLDGQEILNRYNQIKAAQEEEIRQVQTQVALEERNIPANPDSEQLKGIYLGIVVALVGLLIVLSFFMFPAHHKDGLQEAVQLKPMPADIESTVQSETPTRQKLPAPVTVIAVFKESAWVQIRIDGDYLYGADGMTFSPSQPQQIWMAQREMIIKMGNPAGISLNYNGKDLGQFGERGVIRTVRLTPQGFEAL